MRWLLIVLLVSLVAMLIAAAGMTLHIWLQRARQRSRSSAGAAKTPDTAEESDQETEL